MAAGSLSVDEVDGRKELARFVELPQALHGQERCFAPPVMAWERYRVDHRRNPYFDRGDAGFFLARRLGRPVGRIVAHLPHAGGEGRFGFWTLVDDDEVASALVEAARNWLTERGCASMRGPVAFTDDDEPGLLVDGFDVPGCTGRPWHPPHAVRLLEGLGATVVEEQATWRHAVASTGPELTPGGPAPGQAAGYVDPRLVSEAIAAVPDLSSALGTTELRHAWSLARRARRADWDVAVVVRWSGDASAAAAMLSAAGRAGYRTVVARWSAGPSLAPETRHRRYVLRW